MFLPASPRVSRMNLMSSADCTKDAAMKSTWRDGRAVECGNDGEGGRGRDEEDGKPKESNNALEGTIHQKLDLEAEFRPVEDAKLKELPTTVEGREMEQQQLEAQMVQDQTGFAFLMGWSVSPMIQQGHEVLHK